MQRAGGGEDGDVGTARDVDDERVGLAGPLLILGELGAEAVGVDADDVVGLRVEGGSTIEDFDADTVFLQLGTARAEGEGDGVAKESAEANGPLEERVGESALELVEHLLRRGGLMGHGVRRSGWGRHRRAVTVSHCHDGPQSFTIPTEVAAREKRRRGGTVEYKNGKCGEPRDQDSC